MTVQLLTPQEITQRLSEGPINSNYFAMYSSLYGGLTLDSRWMNLPIDDHMVHRGDGVFEALKVKNGVIYLMDQHLARLELSAKTLSIPLYRSLDEMRQLIQTTWNLANAHVHEADGLMRVFLSRGPGSFTTNPYDTVGSQFYVIATRLQPPSKQKYVEGVSVLKSSVPVKAGGLARVKSCNYLPNVLQKKEAVDRGVDFVVSFDPQGFLAEASTENMVIVSQDNFLVRPRGEYILQGCTMVRSFALAEKLQQKGILNGIVQRDISEEDIFIAKEVMMMGTTLDVLPVASYEGRPVGGGNPGPVAQALLQMLIEDQGGPKAMGEC